MSNEQEPRVGPGTQQAGAPQTGAPQTGAGPRVSREEMRDVRRLRRSSDRTVAGVATGLARQFDVDPTLVRIVFVVLAFFGGAGLVLYGALWLLLPSDGEPRATLHLDERSLGIALVGVTVLAALLVLGDSWGSFHFPWPLALAALAVWFLFFRDRGTTASQDASQGASQTASQVGGPEAGGPAYSWSPPPPPPPAPDPRRRGPLLFGFTCALIAFALGCLGLADVAGLEVPGSAYLALALGVVAGMLLLGAFWGRAGGLIALGLVIAVALGGAGVAEQTTHRVVVERPATAGALASGYELAAGELVVDLTEVEDLDDLDGRRVRIDVAAGRAEVLLPAGVDAQVTASVAGPGRVELFGTERGGIDNRLSRSYDAGPGDHPRLELEIEVAVGEIVVRSER